MLSPSPNEQIADRERGGEGGETNIITISGA